jgi:hypothetical protein
MRLRSIGEVLVRVLEFSDPLFPVHKSAGFRLRSALLRRQNRDPLGE